MVLDSDNWAGAIAEGRGISQVSGVFTVPTIAMPTGGTTTDIYCGTAWVGIDGQGQDCDGGLVQAGIDWCIQDDIVTYTPWSEWWPAEDQVNWSHLAVEQGDLISINVTANGRTGGSAVLTNVARGTSASRTWSAMQPGLCQRSAEWIVEDFTIAQSTGDVLAPFADFGQVYWTDTNYRSCNRSQGAAGSSVVDMIQGNAVLATAYLNKDDVIINYGTGY
ncbi:hypothetical protein ZTR_09474 [Talaromyces verruculosus]|nr:hypothetical protein ZTR_09474 [Talaromyces verruculosus]